MQVAGYGLGGLALLWLSPRGLFAAAALADLASPASVRFGLRDRPARTTRSSTVGSGSVEAVGHRGLVRHMAAVKRHLLSSPVIRPLSRPAPCGMEGCRARRLGRSRDVTSVGRPAADSG
jgi:hypothetical protein